jgi:hypothetical protein
MNSALYKYLDIKIHHLLKENTFNKIVVIGEHDRSANISIHEKTDKPFNWMRPSAEVYADTLIIKVYPGTDYVKHYASIISTYLALNGQEHSHVSYVLPSESECYEPLLSSNLKNIPTSHLAVLGYVHGLSLPTDQTDWQGEGEFAWKTTTINRKQIALIGCKHSYWGDISGRVVKILAKQGFEKVIYTGKLGGLNPQHLPNETLATGNQSFLEGHIITWKNLFKNLSHPQIKPGIHYTSPSILYENKEWLKKFYLFDFVDPEIGHMAKAASETGIEFGYLHIISNNLSKNYRDNLSNERKNTILNKRARLLEIIQSSIGKVV